MKFLHRFVVAVFILGTTQTVFAQTTAFNFQGKLTDQGSPANGNYQMQFKMFDAVSGGNQIGLTVSDVPVSVANGTFTTRLDFTASAFPGADRFLEVAVRRNSTDTYVLLSPREQISPSPYAVKAISAQQANIALDAQKLAGIDASEYVTSSTVAGTFIKNDTVQQTANFNIAGTGIVGGRFGVGTTSPGAGLEVRGTGFNAGQRITDNASGNSLVLQSGAGGNMKVTGYNYNTGAAVPLYLSVDGASTILNNNGGDVTIGSPNVPASSVFNGFATFNNGATLHGYTYFTNLATFNNGATFYNNTHFGGTTSFNGTASHSGDVYVGSFFTPRNLYVRGTGFFDLVSLTLGTAGGSALCRNNGGYIAFCSSSMRYKKDIEFFDSGLNVINRLQPITFAWKDGGMRDLGFAAEDVAKVNPLFVTYNDKAEIEGVRYDRMSVVFVNAFKEQQAQIEAQRKTIEEQARKLNALMKFICESQPGASICIENKKTGRGVCNRTNANTDC